MATSAQKQPKANAKAPVKHEPDAQEETVAPRRKERSMPVIMLLVLLLAMLGGAGGGAWYFLREPSAEEPDKPGVTKAGLAKAAASKAAPAKPVSSKPPVFVPLDQFTVNLQPEDGAAQFLQVGLSIKVAENATGDTIKLHTPEIRNRVLLLLSGKKASEISSTAGKNSLSAELVREISQPLAGKVQAGAIDSVLFTSFVIQ